MCYNMYVIWGEFMKKHELLVPAGNMECLYQAVSNGADAVYLGCKMFGARKYASNFTNDEILEAIKYCHLYGVKVYVTMNTLVKNSEVDSFINQASFLHKNGVDALIVQDFGMICLLREKFPNLEIHASTQANISSYDVCDLYYKLGVKRVVFSRELSIDEIDSIDVPIEKEAFIHGALCISYSGNCLMSSMLGGRSGNRGECAGTCRMLYSLIKDDKTIEKDKYLLSTKELNTSSSFKRLLDSSIYSFKIEGRMKSPLYVGFVTNLYRNLIDGNKINLEEENNKLKTIFNREFTNGRMFKTNDSDFMNTFSPNHKGLNIGKVIGFTKNKIKIKLDDGFVLNQNDAIRFVNVNKGFIVNYLYDQNDKLISSSNNICYVDNKVDLMENDVVSKTQDYKLEKEYLSIKNEKKINVIFNVYAHVGEKLVIEISDLENIISIEGNIVEKSINSSLDETSIMSHICKLGNTPFICKGYNCDLDMNIFIPVKELNEIRRSLVNQLKEKRENKNIEFIEKCVSFDKKNDSNIRTCNCYFVKDKEQLDLCIKYPNSRVYTSNRELYDEYKNSFDNIYYFVRRELFKIKENLVNKNVVSDYANYIGFDVIGNYSLNVTNIYTAYYLRKIGVYNVCLSVEMSEDELLDFINLYNNKFGKCIFDILVYGRVENMIIKGNILNIEKDNFKYYLIDFKDRRFPVYYDGINTHILNYECKKIDTNRFRGICNLRYDFYDENTNFIEAVVNQ